MIIFIAIFLGGLSALTWEVLWLQLAALAIGVSAQAAAIILSAMMLGMMVGSLAAGAFLQRFKGNNYVRLLAGCELMIGLAGLGMMTGFRLVEMIDTWVYQLNPSLASSVQAIGLICVLGVPTFFMGATVPIFAKITKQFETSLARLYATNIVGASFGIVLATFVFIPLFGVKATALMNVYVNLLAASFAFIAKPSHNPRQPAPSAAPQASTSDRLNMPQSSLIVLCTGLTTFALEVVWFRSLRAALQATTESFSLMLFATLISLAVGGYIAPYLRDKKNVSLAFLLALTGFFILVMTPVIERFDLLVPQTGAYTLFLIKRFFFVLITLGIPMTLLGIGLPWVLELHTDGGKVSRLYAINTFGAVLGSLAAAWFILPIFGAVKGAWLVGILPLAVAVFLGKGRQVLAPLMLGVCGLLIAASTQSGVGQLRVQGITWVPKYELLASREGPDSTVSVIEDPLGTRLLIIDGFMASGENKEAHYMEWMGRLPMLLHNDPKDALVICFGTGQTANGVRLEGSRRLDIVDVNPAVFEVAHLFDKNQRVLEDVNTSRIVMDGRAYLKRTKRTYDVITLEPMAPTMAGSNSLYSLEFYEQMKVRLNPDGVVAQWLPFHLVDPVQSASIVATFIETFPDSILWIDPKSYHGILLGFNRSEKEAQPLTWPGLARKDIPRGLSAQHIRGSLTFNSNTLTRFAQLGEVITDDNQFLSYGYGRMKWSLTSTILQRQRYIIDILLKIANELEGIK